MISLKNIFFVGIGGGLGAILRYLFSIAFKQGIFPLNTFLINIFGSLFIGIIYALNTKSEWISDPLKLFLATGVCGGFTTFSAFSLENVQLIKEGNFATAGLYIFASIACCILACFAGFKIIQP